MNNFEHYISVPGLDIDTKYLKRLYAFQDFRKNQEEQIAELSEHMKSFKRRTDSVEEELKDTLNKFVQRQRDLSMTLTLTKTGKKLNDKVREAQAINCT